MLGHAAGSARMMQQLVLDIGLSRGPSLDNFCVGPNAAAVAHLRNWVSTPAATRSALATYVWGASGSGKTHLLRAVQAELLARGERVGWLDAGVVLPEAFDESWSAVILDQVHEYDANQQQAAFNWFVNAQTLQRAVLAAGDLPPTDLALRDDLRTRLGSGLVFGLQAPDDVQRRAVLRSSAEARGMVLNDEVLDFMLTRFSRELSSLMELLNLMDSYALQTQRTITIPLIKSMLDHAS